MSVVCFGISFSFVVTDNVVGSRLLFDAGLLVFVVVFVLCFGLLVSFVSAFGLLVSFVVNVFVAVSMGVGFVKRFGRQPERTSGPAATPG